jgi:predicted Zn-dependent peptidase
LIDYDGIQTDIYIIKGIEEYKFSDFLIYKLFDNYYFSVFSIESTKYALAYSMSARYRYDLNKLKNFYLEINTSVANDKVPKTMAVIDSIFNLKDLIINEKYFKINKGLLVSGLALNSFKDEEFMDYYIKLQKLGIDYDYIPEMFDIYKNAKIGDLERFYTENVYSTDRVIIIAGKKSELNLKEIEKYGEVVELKLDEIYTF